MKAKKLQFVKLDLIDINMGRNVREQVEASYDDPAMRDSLALIGQQTTAKLLKLPNGRFEPIQGNRRTFNMKKLAAAGVLDPKTAKRDSDGNIIRDETGKPVGAKVFEIIEAEVYEDLSERERVELLVDDGNKRLLNKVELFFALEFQFNAGYTEKEVVIISFGLLQLHYPPSRQVKDTAADGGQDALEYYRGVVQTAKDAWRSPTVVRDAWVTKLKTGRAWPIKKEMTQAYSIFKKEQDEDKTGRINRQNPGPKFREFWNGVVNKHEAAAAKGEKRGKSSAMMNNEQVSTRVSTCDSRIIKAVLKCVLRQISEDKLPVLDTGLVKLMNGEISTKDLDAILDTVFAADESDTGDAAGGGDDKPAEGTPPESKTALESEVTADDAAAEDPNGGPPTDVPSTEGDEQSAK